jgi:acyl homoserine lactone synthase
MIRLIQGNQRSSYVAEINEMHVLRRLVFAERLGWDVSVQDGWEIDSFDEADPLYLLSIDPKNNLVRGSLRLLPTTGPNMLRDVFSCLLPEGQTIESATIWESTRFSVHPDYLEERSTNGLNLATGELLAGIVEVGLLAGLTQVLSVYDARIARILKRAGCPADVIGTPQRIGTVMTYAGLFEISEPALTRIQQVAGIEGSVLEARSNELALASAA